MSQPETPAAAAQPAVNQPESRTCTKCAATKVVTPDTWPYRKETRPGALYQAHGQLCLDCVKKRKNEYDARRRAIVADAKASAVPDEGKPADKRKALTAASKMDVAAALKTGSTVLNQVAPSVLARVMEYLEDPDHKHHLWALELLAQRILPRKLYEELGGQAAGVGAIADRRPQIVINVQPASPDAPSGNVYENDPSPGMLPVLQSPESE